MTISSLAKIITGVKRMVVENVEIENPETNPTIIISVRPTKRDSCRCGICGKKCSGYDKGNGRRRWRAMDIGNSSKVYLESDSPRVWCKEHGVTVQMVPWARHGSKHTKGFEDTAVWMSLHLSRKAVSEYESVVRLHLKPALGDIPLSQLRTPMVQKFYNKLRAEQRSPKYIKNIHGVLHRALDMAVRVEYLERNPTSACILPKVVEKQVTPLDAPEQKRLFEALKGNPFEALFLTAVFTGMRVGEIIGLTWDCVDFEHGVIHIEKQLVQTRVKGQDYVFGTLKNGKTRVIAPAPFVMEVLKKHKADQKAQKREMGDLWDEGKFPGLVFNHPDGSHYSQPTIWKEFQDILAAAGLEHHRVHDLRHTFAVNSIRAGDDIKTLQENMGHYSAAFTLDRYGHVTETMRRESANRMQAFIEKMA